MTDIKQKLHEIGRYYLKKSLTGNLGKVVEEQDRLVCYVKKSKCKKENLSYTIACRGLRAANRTLAKQYNLDKPICYIIDDLEFKGNIVYIFGYDNCEVVIRNCHFDFNLNIHVNGKCTLENSFIQALSYLSIGADELIIKNMDIKNLRHVKSNLKIYLGTDEKLEIVDSYIGRKGEYTTVSIFSDKELSFDNAKIAGDNVEIEAKSIESSNTLISAKKEVKLKIDEFEKLDITSPTIVYNGDTFSHNGKRILLEKVVDPVITKRLELIKTLKNIKNECEGTINSKIEQYESSLKEQPICKTLKR